MPKLAEIAGIGNKGGGEGYVGPTLGIISATPTSGGVIQEGQTLTVTLGGPGIYVGDSIDYTISSVSVADITLTTLCPNLLRPVSASKSISLESKPSTKFLIIDA